LTADGLSLEDKLSLEFLVCDRSTRNVENSHRTIHDTSGTQYRGTQSSDSLSSELRHRNNQRGAKRKGQGFPNAGLYIMWLKYQEHTCMDHTQNISLYLMWYYPASDYPGMPGHFQTVLPHLKTQKKNQPAEHRNYYMRQIHS
jgi:hypothetical protein